MTLVISIWDRFNYLDLIAGTEVYHIKGGFFNPWWRARY